nr:hypothetical protein [Tanacetum cinerariifolium]
MESGWDSREKQLQVLAGEVVNSVSVQACGREDGVWDIYIVGPCGLLRSNKSFPLQLWAIGRKVTLIAFSSSKSSSTKGDVLEGGGVSSNVMLSDSLIFMVCLLRGQSLEKVTMTDLFFLCSIDEGTVVDEGPPRQQGRDAGGGAQIDREALQMPQEAVVAPKTIA